MTSPPHFDHIGWRKQIDIWKANEIEKPEFVHKEWTWNHNSWSYEGVHTFENHLVWFRQTNNPHGSTGGTQSFKDFLKRGPMVTGASSEQLLEIYAVVCTRLKIDF